MGASWRILVSVLTVPFPREASSRMWGYEVFFPVAQLVLAAPLFILVMASQQKRWSWSGEARALSLPRADLQAQLHCPSCSWAKPLICLAVMTYLSTSWAAASPWTSWGYFRLPEILARTVVQFLHFCAPSFWGICSCQGELSVWSQLGLLIVLVLTEN